MTWHTFFVAMALILVVEGLIPFINPEGAKRMWLRVSEMPPQQLRIIGFVSVIAGLLLLGLINRVFYSAA